MRFKQVESILRYEVYKPWIQDHKEEIKSWVTTWDPSYKGTPKHIWSSVFKPPFVRVYSIKQFKGIYPNWVPPYPSARERDVFIDMTYYPPLYYAVPEVRDHITGSEKQVYLPYVLAHEYFHYMGLPLKYRFEETMDFLEASAHNFGKKFEESVRSYTEKVKKEVRIYLISGIKSEEFEPLIHGETLIQEEIREMGGLQREI